MIQELNEYSEVVGLSISTDPKKTIIMSNKLEPGYLFEY